ncbi:MAG: hypothetical protein IKL70_00945 [Oscillospiraceae bacterium]|nr:hypothetical protein [Oscillospiraceae bacterium]MBR6694966.1 hypothetical protein [Oscillospiraceae bacterium]
MVVCLFSQDDDFSSLLKRLSDTDCVILTGDISVIEKIPENADIIVSSDNKDALKKLSSEKMNVITCGGAKDTIGYSSNSDDEIVVSVQREILSLSGKKYEPFEIPLIKLSGETEYSAMAYVGIMTKIKNPLD